MDIPGIWYAVTLLGTPEYWAFAALGLVAIYFAFRHLAPGNPAWKKHRPAFRKFLFVLVPSILLVFGTILLIKNVTYVQRPCTPCSANPGDCNPYCDTDSSFPSGHAGTAFMAFSSLYLAFRKRWLLPLFIIPALISCSRIALGVHTWVDVLGGTFIGLVIPVLVAIMIQKQHKAR